MKLVALIFLCGIAKIDFVKSLPSAVVPAVVSNNNVQSIQLFSLYASSQVHPEIVKTHQKDIDNLISTSTNSIERVKLLISSTKDIIKDKINEAVLTTIQDILGLRSFLNSELKKPKVIKDKTLTGCVKYQIIMAAGLNTDKLKQCEPTDEYSTWNLFLDDTVKLKTSASNIISSCSKINAADSQEAAMETCLSTKVTEIGTAVTGNPNQLRTITLASVIKLDTDLAAEATKILTEITQIKGSC